MTNQTDGPGPGRKQAAPGCIVLLAVFLVISFAGALAALAVYVLLVEQLGVIQVRREFGYEMIVYAPLAGLACGFAAAFWATRGGALERRATVLLGLGLVVALALLLIFFGVGAVL